jgi:hypothetical protein
MLKSLGKWIAGIAATVIGGLLVWWLTGGSQPPSSTPPTPPPPTPFVETPETSGPETLREPEPQNTQLDDCVITIENPLVPLMSEPQPLSQELIQLDPGDYRALRYSVEDFAGTEQGWFLIEAEGRRGWIKNNTITIDEKSEECPYG